MYLCKYGRHIWAADSVHVKDMVNVSSTKPVAFTYFIFNEEYSIMLPEQDTKNFKHERVTEFLSL